jgi:hypothetical protein
MCSLPRIWLTVDHKSTDDPYVIKYEFRDQHGEPVRIKCDARFMVSEERKKQLQGCNRPGLGRYAVINERLCNVKFVNKGVGTWGFIVREGLEIKKGEEIFRQF